MSRIRDLKREGLTIRGVAAVLGITKDEVVVGLDPSGELPDGGDVGEVLTNTAPGEGDWQPIQPEVSQFALNMPTVLDGGQNLLTITGRDWDGSQGGDIFDTTLFVLDGADDDVDNELVVLKSGLYRMSVVGRRMTVDVDPVRALPVFDYYVDGDGSSDGAVKWQPEAYTSDGAVAAAASVTFVMSLERFLFIEAPATLQFELFVPGIEDINVSSSCVLYARFQRLGDL